MASDQQSAFALRRLFFDLQRIIKPQLFIEAGAHKADVSLEMRQCLPTARIVAFEANPNVYNRCRTRVGGQIEYLNLALTDEPGVVTFNVPTSVGGKPLSHMTTRSSLGILKGDATYDRVEVNATSLDSFFPPPVPPCSLWIDVEGGAGQVLRGSRNVLSVARSLLIEVENVTIWDNQWLEVDVIKFLTMYGLTPCARDFERTRQHNVLFLRDIAAHQETLEKALQSPLLALP
jgi:FkbM family methyltransferase